MSHWYMADCYANWKIHRDYGEHRTNTCNWVSVVRSENMLLDTKPRLMAVILCVCVEKFISRQVNATGNVVVRSICLGSMYSPLSENCNPKHISITFLVIIEYLKGIINKIPLAWQMNQFLNVACGNLYFPKGIFLFGVSLSKHLCFQDFSWVFIFRSLFLNWLTFSCFCYEA